MTPEQDDAPPVAIDEVFLVPAALVDERVDRAVALLTGWSRGDVQALLDRDGILVSGRAVGKSHRLARGDVIEVLDVPHGVPLPEPEDVTVDVRYADDGVIVVSKPDGSERRIVQSPTVASECSTWSPDGNKLAICGHTGDGNWAIWVIGDDGSGGVSHTRQPLSR